MACSKDLYQSFEDEPPDDKDVFLKDKSFFGNEPGNHYRNAINDFVFTHLNILKDHPLVVESAKTWHTLIKYENLTHAYEAVQGKNRNTLF